MYLRRFARKLGIDRNPLRRRSDRVETWVGAAVLAVVLAIAPFVVWHAAASAYRGAVAQSTDERVQGRFKVDAVLLRDSSPRTTSGSEYVEPEANPAPARWRAPDGTPRTGTVTPPAPAPAGSLVPIWIDAHGTLTEAPVSPSPAGEAFAAGTAVTIGLALGAALVLLALRGLVDRRRMAGWQLEWMYVEPRWSGRR